MSHNKKSERIRSEAKKLDDAVEDKDMETILSCFAENCEIELFGVQLAGKDGIQKGINWMYNKLDEIKFEPLHIIVDDNIFFEEFFLKAKPESGAEVRIKAAEVLIYRDLKITSLRLYLDRMQLGNLFADGWLEKYLFQKMNSVSLKGLV